MRTNRVGLKVGAFTLAMLLVAASLVLTFGQFFFGSTQTYYAQFETVSQLKAGQDVRIAGIKVGTVKGVDVHPDTTAVVAFSVDEVYQLYTSTHAVIRYQDLVGNRYLEITSGPGELRKLPPGGTIALGNTKPALDLDALLGGLRPVLKGLDGQKINDVSNAIIDLLQGNGGSLAEMLTTTGSFTQELAARDQLIGDLIGNLQSVIATVDARSAELDESVDSLQQLMSTLASGRDPIGGAIPGLASAEVDLTEMLENSRRPLKGVIDNIRPLATALDENQAEVNKTIEPLAENYQRMNSLGAYGSFFNIYFCSVNLKINGPAGSDIIVPFGGPPDPSKGRCAFAE